LSAIINQKRAFLLICIWTLLIAQVCIAQEADPIAQKLNALLENDLKLREEKKVEERIILLQEGLEIALAEKRADFAGTFHFRLGALYLTKKEFQKSEEHLKNALVTNPSNPAEIHSYLGRVYFLQDRLEEAEREFLAGLDFERLKPHSLNQLTVIAILQNRQQDALKYVTEWEKVAPEMVSVYWRKGFILTELKRFEEAESAYLKSLEIKPTTEGYLYFGNLRFLQERDKEALELMLKAEKLAPEDPEVQWRIGVVHQYANNPAEAKQRFLTSIRLKPTVEAYRPYVQLLFVEGENQEGEEAYKKFIELGGKPTAHLVGLYASALIEQDRFEEAVDQWKQAYEKEPEHPAVISGLGYTLFMLERMDEAAPLMEKAIRMKTEKGENAEKEIGLVAVIYDILGRYEEGAALLKQTVEAGKRNNDPVLSYVGELGLADLYAKQGNYRLAMESGKRAVDAVRKDPKYRTLRALALITLADQSISIRNTKEAEGMLAEVSPLIEKLEPAERSSKWILFYMVESNLFRQREEYLKAIESTTKALKYAQESQAKDKQLDALIGLDVLYRTTGNFAKSNEIFVQSLKLLEEIEDKQLQVKYLESAASTFARNGNYVKALEYTDRSLKSPAVQKIPIPAAEALQARAHYLALLGRYEDAIATYQLALERISAKPRVPRQIASCKVGMSKIHTSLGNYSEAKKLLEEAKKLYEQIERRDLVVGVAVLLGDLDYDLGDYKKAFQTYQQAATHYHELQSWSDESEQYFMMGVIQEEQKRYREALIYFQKSLTLSEQKKDIISALYAKDGIARQQMFMGNYAESRKQLDEINQIIQSEGAALAGLKRSVLQSMGEFHFLQSQYKEAEASFLPLVESELNASYPTRWRAWYFLGLAQREQNKSQEALKSLQTSVEIIERMRQATAGTPQDGNFRSRYREIYNALIDLLFREGKLDDAYYYIELEKIAEFQEQRLASQRFKEAQREGTIKARQYQFRLMEIQKQLSDELSKDSAYRDQDLVDNLNRFRGVLEKEFKSYLKDNPELEDRLEHKPRQLGSIMNSIPEGVVVIQPVVRPDRIAALVYTHAGRIAAESPPVTAAEVTKKLNDFRSSLRDGSTDEVKEISATFYEWLIKPIENQIDEARLLVVAASGNLRKIPFQALYDSKNGKFLIEKITVVNLASLKFEYPDWVKEDIRILALANPMKDLEAAEDQAIRIAKIFPTKIFSGDQAAPESLRWDKTKEKFTVLMFATHAKLDDLEPEQSFIQLANNTQLTYADISEYRPYWQDEIRLAVLSGCETAALPEIEESAISHLAGEFDEIGIHSIVASLWKVNDASTSDLMVSFFENLKKNLSLAESLQQAQLKLLAEKKSPYHWAPFILFGDWR
jgi:CHAT domain-containing protein/Flp pilus assembly protein TadD